MMLNHSLFITSRDRGMHLLLSLNHKDCWTGLNNEKWCKGPLNNIWKYYCHLETKKASQGIEYTSIWRLWKQRRVHIKYKIIRRISSINIKNFSKKALSHIHTRKGNMLESVQLLCRTLKRKSHIFIYLLIFFFAKTFKTRELGNLNVLPYFFGPEINLYI